MLGDMGIAPQRTLGAAARCRGIGLHSGQPVAMTLRPAMPDIGIVFRRLDAGAEIKANWSNTIEAALSSVLSNGEGTQIGTVEHLMAALAGCRIDNAIVELDGPEVPIMDGSAAPFVLMIERVTGVGRARPTAPVAAPRVQAAPVAAPRAAPAAQPRLAPLDPEQRTATSKEDDLLDIPAFLRRQAN